MNFRYPGTKPFSAADKNIFFGRAQVLEELYKNVCLNQLTVLFGKSGVGKTSLLNAGLLPWFEENPQFVSIQVRFGAYHESYSVTPSETLNRQLTLFAQKPTFLDDISPDELSLWHLFKNILLDYSHKEGILLVFDQFEELFTYPDEQIRAFSKIYAELISERMPDVFQEKMAQNRDNLTEIELEFLEEPIPHRIVMAIRTENLDQINALMEEIPFIRQNCFELKPLCRESAKSALIEPAQQTGDFVSPNFTYSTEAVEAILAHLTQQYSKEIEAVQLQATCQKMEQFLMEKASILPLTDAANSLQIEEQEVENRLSFPKILEETFVEKTAHAEEVIEAKAENAVLEEEVAEPHIEAEEIQEVAPDIAIQAEEVVREETQVQAEVIAQTNRDIPTKPTQNTQPIKWIVIGIVIVALLIFASWYFA